MSTTHPSTTKQILNCLNTNDLFTQTNTQSVPFAEAAVLARLDCNNPSVHHLLHIRRDSIHSHLENLHLSVWRVRRSLQMMTK